VINQDGNPIIIKKTKAHSGGHHGGAWKVAYADFVTAMMALFIVLWVLGQDDAVKESIAKYFKDPIGLSSKGRNVLQGNSKKIPDSDLQTQIEQRESEKLELKNMGDKLLSELAKDPEFANITGQIKIEIVDEGLRIEMLDSDQNVFFEIGTSKLKPEAVSLLKKIGDYISTIPNKIVIEGHTDARPYTGKDGYTNFELSADRANSARRALELSKIDPTKIDEIRGYADRRLRDKEDPFNLVNRRISIIVKFLNKKIE
jgi:chemotaxis protein MotB